MTEDEWLDACADKPDDDFVRLAFADWLQERGQSDWATFIRLQIEAALLPARLSEKARQAHALRRKHGDQWLGARLQLAPPECWIHHRGLPEELDFEGRANRLRDLAALAASPYLARIRILNLREIQIGDDGAAALAASPQVRRLTALRLAACGIGDRGATALANSPHLARLTRLELNYNMIGDVGVTALANSPHLARLTKLELIGNEIGDLGVQALEESPHLQSLQHVDL